MTTGTQELIQKALSLGGHKRKAGKPVQKKRRIVCHEGTGTGIVKAVVERLGGVLRVVNTLEEAQTLSFDGLLLLGGADINPAWYGEAITHATRIDQKRDIIEWCLIRRAITAGVPAMGICRGNQMLAAAHGGSLYQDLLADGVTTRNHSGRGHRLVDVMRPLARHMPGTRQVNSYHHQAVKTVPHGFDVAAESEDGVIEAIWRPGYLGVQWHPELLIGQGDSDWVTLFKWFMAGLD